jgi:hypothetical protein
MEIIAATIICRRILLPASFEKGRRSEGKILQERA